MKYKVIEWEHTSPHTASCFSYTEPTAAIKQAIINDIRENGYFFDRTCYLAVTSISPILNTGEAVSLSAELCKELVCRAYGFNEAEYDDYFYRVVKNPCPDFEKPSNFVCEYPMKRIVWVNDDAFDELKASILNGNSNVDIIPDDYIQLKQGDVIRYTSVDESKYFEVKIKKFFSSTVLPKVSDIERMDAPNTQSIINLIDHDQNKYVISEQLLYRYEGLSGKEIYDNFKRIYGTELLGAISMVLLRDFDCKINIIVFDKNNTFEPTILEMPDDIPVSEEVMKRITDDYKMSIQEEKRKKEEAEQRLLRLKEKFAKRKLENKE